MDRGNIRMEINKYAVAVLRRLLLSPVTIGLDKNNIFEIKIQHFIKDGDAQNYSTKKIKTEKEI